MTEKIKDPHTTTVAFVEAIQPDAGAFSKRTNDLYRAAAAVHDILAGVQAATTEIERLRRAADAAEESREIFVLFERVKGKNDALLREVGNAMKALDKLTDTSAQYDELAVEIKKSIDERPIRLAVTPPAP